MIPQFPNFKELEISDKEDIEKITSKFPPYSDFNFISMWSWDTKGDIRISELFGNLIVRFNDYLTGVPFYSYLGNNNVNEVAETLIRFSKKEHLDGTLQLLPEDSIKGLDDEKFIITEDRNHFDYIFSIKNIASYEGSFFQRHRNKVRRFEKKHKFEVLSLSLSNPINQKLLLDLVEYWVDQKKTQKNNTEDYLHTQDLENELIAFKKLLTTPLALLDSLVCCALFIDGNLSGFIINEKISDEYCLAHFGKADTKYDGIYHFLMHKNAKPFLDLGINYLNHEQDLGLPNLRFSKEGYNPVHFLKKYIVSLPDVLV